MRPVLIVLFGVFFDPTALLARQPPPASALPPIQPAAARASLTLECNAGPLWGVVAASDGGVLWAGSEQGLLYCWHPDVTRGVRSGHGAGEQIAAHTGPVLAIAAARATVVSAGADGKILIRDSSNRRVVREIVTPGPVRALAIAADGGMLAFASDGATVQLRDTVSGAKKLDLGGGDWFLAVAFSPDGGRVAATGYDGRLRLWQTGDGKLIYDTDLRPASPDPATRVATALAFAPDGKLLASAGNDGAIQLVNANDGKPVKTLTGHTGAVTALAFHPGGDLLASAAKDRTVRLWSVSSGKPIKTLEGHGSWVQGLTFFASGTRLASVGADRMLRLWDLTSPAKP